MRSGKNRIQEYRGDSQSMRPDLMSSPPQRSFSDSGLQSGGENEFAVKNNLFEMQSRCNSLEYDMYKKAIYYTQTINSLQGKINELQQYIANITDEKQSIAEERDLLKTLLWEVREQNYSFSKEIAQLRLKLSTIISNSSSKTQDGFREYGEFQMKKSLKYDLVQKQRLIEGLKDQLQEVQYKKRQDKALAQMRKSQMQTNQQLQNYIKRQVQLKEQFDQLKDLLQNRQKMQKIELNNKQAEVQSLQAQFDTFERRNKSLTTELQWVKAQLNAKQEQIKTIQKQRMERESKIGELSVEVSRLKCQKNNLQQYNSYLQSTTQQSQLKRKNLQEEIFKIQKESSDLRTQLFNEKLQSKKQLSNLRLQFQEERISHLQTVEEKSKEINSLKQQNLNSNRQSIQIQEFSLKTKGALSQLERANQQINELKNSNQMLIKQLRSNESKLQKKHEKYCTLQNKLRGENEQRVKSLQSQIYKQLQTIGQLEVRLELSQNNTKHHQFQKGQSGSNQLKILKQQIKIKDQKVKELQLGKRQLIQKNRLNEELIFKLEGERRMQRQKTSIEDKNERIGTLQMLQEEINRLNQDIRQQRSAFQQYKKDNANKEQKLKRQIQLLQSTNLRTNSDKKALIQRNNEVQSQLRLKNKQIEQLNKNLKDSVEQNVKQQTTYKYKIEELLNQNLIKQQKLTTELVQKKKQATQDLNKKEIARSNELIKKLQKQNLKLKQDYSESLQEINSLLINYQQLQEKTRRQSIKNQKIQEVDTYLSSRIQQLQHECQRLRIVLQQQDREIQRLTSLLDQKRIKQNINTHQITHRSKADQLWLAKDYQLTEESFNTNGQSTFRHKHHHRI